MRLFKLSLILAFILSFHTTQAQVEFLATVDPSTAIHTDVNDLPDVMWITTLPYYTDFNEYYGTFVFRGSEEDLDWKLYTVDAATGEVMHKPQFPILQDEDDNVIHVQIDNSNGLAYALHWDNSEQTEYLVSVNRMTGEHTIIKSIPEVQSIQDLPNFDKKNGHFIFQGRDAQGDLRLYTIEASTGDMVSNPIFPTSLDEWDNVIGLQFDNTTEQLYGLHFDDSEQTEYLISINQATGEFTKLFSIPQVSGIVVIPRYITFDENNGIFYFLGAGADINSTFFGIDVESGAIVSNPEFPSFEDPEDNIIEFQFDNATGTMFALHWDAKIRTSTIAAEYNNQIKIYPNPFDKVTYVAVDKIQSDFNVDIFNSNGQHMHSIRKNNCKEVEIQKNNLLAGIYFLQIKTNQFNATRKLIIH